MDLETATAADIYRYLLDVQDKLNEMVSDDLLTIERDAEQVYGTARNAISKVVEHLEAARQILAAIETRN